MDVCVLSRDLMFFTAAEGAAGALGHSVRQAETIDEVGSPALLVADFVSFPQEITALTALMDPEQIAIFTPHERVDVFTGARANGIAEVHRRGALAKELPRILGERAPLYAESAGQGE